MSATIAARRSVARRQARSSASSDSGAGTTGTRTFRYSSASAGPITTGARTVSVSGSCTTAAVDDVDDEADREPAEARPARGGFCTTTTSHASAVASPPKSANSGQSTPRKRRFGRRGRRAPRRGACDAQRDHRRVRDREREHRAERVHRPEEVRLARQEHEHRDHAGEDDEREPRRLELRCSRRKTSGSWR